MLYVGLGSEQQADCGLRRERAEAVCVYEGTGPASRAGLRAVVQAVGAGPKLVVLEAGSQMKWVADTLMKRADVQVHVVHPNEVKWITESRGKTDRVDAMKLAELARGGCCRGRCMWWRA